MRPSIRSNKNHSSPKEPDESRPNFRSFLALVVFVISAFAIGGMSQSAMAAGPPVGPKATPTKWLPGYDREGNIAAWARVNDLRRVGFGVSAEIRVSDARSDYRAVFGKLTLNVNNGPDASIAVKDTYNDNQVSDDDVLILPPKTAGQTAGNSLPNTVKLEVRIDGYGVSTPYLPTVYTLKVPPLSTTSSNPAKLREAERYLSSITLTKFIEYQKDFRKKQGSNSRYGGFDWRQDGCSNPKSIAGVPNAAAYIWNPKFLNACARHDFAYRNIGVSNGGPGYGVWDAKRHQIDNQFKNDLNGICNRSSLTPKNLVKCKAAALAYYQGVDKFGATSFFGQASDPGGARVVKSAQGRSRSGDDANVPSGIKPLEGVAEEPVLDTIKPVLSNATASNPAGEAVQIPYSLAASDNVGVRQMRARINGGAWRDWATYQASGTIQVPDTLWGQIRLDFQVRDAAGNESVVQTANNVNRRAKVTLAFRQILNDESLRACGNNEQFACEAEHGKRFKVSFTGKAMPDSGWITIKAFHRPPGGTGWTEYSAPTFRTYANNGADTRILAPLCGAPGAGAGCSDLPDGLWRFDATVGVSDQTEADGVAKSQFMKVGTTTPPAPTDSVKPVLSNATASNPANESNLIPFALTATDNVGITQMQVRVNNGTWRDWGNYHASGTIQVPDTLWGPVKLDFKVRDAAGNESVVQTANTVNRRAKVTLAFKQILNDDSPRSCGSNEQFACEAEHGKRFKVSFTGKAMPDSGWITIRAYHRAPGANTFTEYSPPTFRTYANNGADSRILAPLCGAPGAGAGCSDLPEGLWRFDATVGVSDQTEADGEAKSQFMKVGTTPPAPTDSVKPVISNATASNPANESNLVPFTLTATDNVGITQMQVRVNDGPWRDWGNYHASGTIQVVDSLWGPVKLDFRVRDAAGNQSDIRTANTVNRRAKVTLAFKQILNDDSLRTCGNNEQFACEAEHGKRFKVTFTGEAMPNSGWITIKAFHRPPGGTGWTEYSAPTFRTYANNGADTRILAPLCGAPGAGAGCSDLPEGLWRFDATVGVSDQTEADGVAKSQFMKVSPPPDTQKPVLSNATATNPTNESNLIPFTLTATDNVGITQMQVRVNNGTWRDWGNYHASGTILVPDTLWGPVKLDFKVRDAAGNESVVQTANIVNRRAKVTLAFTQILNDDSPRTCGNNEQFACEAEHGKRFKVSFTGKAMPDSGWITIRAYHRAPGGTGWTEYSPPTFRTYANNGADTRILAPLCGAPGAGTGCSDLPVGLWRFDATVGVSDQTEADGVAKSQFMKVSPPPDTTKPVLSNATASNPANESNLIPFSLAGSDNVGITQMRVRVDSGTWRDWGTYYASGTIQVPTTTWGQVRLDFQVRDAAGNESVVQTANIVYRRANISIKLVQLSNAGAERSCGSETNVCDSKSGRTLKYVISGAVLPAGAVSLYMWNKSGNSWVQSSGTFRTYTINGSTRVMAPICPSGESCATLSSGSVRRFQVTIGATDSTNRADSGMQHMTINH